MYIKKRLKNLTFTLLFIALFFVLFRSFLVNQVMLRAGGYLQSGMYKDAARKYRMAAALDPADSQIRSWLGYSYNCAGDKDNAIRAHEEAIRLDSQNIMAHNDLGLIYMMDERYELAKEYFLKGSSITLKDEGDADNYVFYHRNALMMLSICQERLGEIDEAIKTNEKILEYYPNHKLAEERIIKLKNLKR